MMSSDKKERDRKVEEEIARTTDTLANLGPASRRRRRAERPDPPQSPSTDPAPTPPPETARAAPPAPNEAPDAPTSTDVDEAPTPRAQPATETTAAQPPTKKPALPAKTAKPKRAASQQGSAANKPPTGTRTYRVRLPVDLAEQFDEIVQERNVSYSYAIRLAFAKNNETLTAAITSDDAKALERAGMEPPRSPALGETIKRPYTVSAHARSVMDKRAKELELTVPAMLREVLRLEVDQAQRKKT